MAIAEHEVKLTADVGCLRLLRLSIHHLPMILRRHQTLRSEQTHRRTYDQFGRTLSTKMSYYFTVIGTRDNPLFEIDFGTSKVGGDGIARFREEAKHMNQFIVHAALDLVEEAQWSTKDL